MFKRFNKEFKDWIFHGPMTIAENVCNQIGILFISSNESEILSQDDISGMLLGQIF